MNPYEIISIVGPTATGKTGLAVAVADALHTEIISADSRQVYRGMDIGTGKDLCEYTINGHTIPYHLINILDAGDKYNLFEFQQDFTQVYQNIKQRGLTPVLCGGTGLYTESVLKGYRLLPVPQNDALRAELSGKTLTELTDILSTMQSLHNTTDVDTVKRAIRAIEIAQYQKEHADMETEIKPIHALIVAMDIDRELRRERITKRLHARLNEGMIDEVQTLLDQGVSEETLVYYGLEYKFVTMYLTGQLSYNEMVRQLEIAIHQFSKRQMTWYRGMERRGFKLHWLPVTMPISDRVNQILTWYQTGDNA